MPSGYEINELKKEDSWRMFRIIGEFVEGFDKLSDVDPAVSIYGSARLTEKDPLYRQIWGLPSSPAAALGLWRPPIGARST